MKQRRKFSLSEDFIGSFDNDSINDDKLSNELETALLEASINKVKESITEVLEKQRSYSSELKSSVVTEHADYDLQYFDIEDELKPVFTKYKMFFSDTKILNVPNDIDKSYGIYFATGADAIACARKCKILLAFNVFFDNDLNNWVNSYFDNKIKFLINKSSEIIKGSLLIYVADDVKIHRGHEIWSLYEAKTSISEIEYASDKLQEFCSLYGKTLNYFYDKVLDKNKSSWIKNDHTFHSLYKALNVFLLSILSEYFSDIEYNLRDLKKIANNIPSKHSSNYYTHVKIYENSGVFSGKEWCIRVKDVKNIIKEIIDTLNNIYEPIIEIIVSSIHELAIHYYKEINESYIPSFDDEKDLDSDNLSDEMSSIISEASEKAAIINIEEKFHEVGTKLIRMEYDDIKTKVLYLKKFFPESNFSNNSLNKLAFALQDAIYDISFNFGKPTSTIQKGIEKIKIFKSKNENFFLVKNIETKTINVTVPSNPSTHTVQYKILSLAVDKTLSYILILSELSSIKQYNISILGSKCVDFITPIKNGTFEKEFQMFADVVDTIKVKEMINYLETTFEYLESKSGLNEESLSIIDILLAVKYYIIFTYLKLLIFILGESMINANANTESNKIFTYMIYDNEGQELCDEFHQFAINSLDVSLEMLEPIDAYIKAHQS